MTQVIAQGVLQLRKVRAWVTHSTGCGLGELNARSSLPGCALLRRELTSLSTFHLVLAYLFSLSCFFVCSDFFRNHLVSGSGCALLKKNKNLYSNLNCFFHFCLPAFLILERLERIVSMEVVNMGQKYFSLDKTSMCKPGRKSKISNNREINQTGKKKKSGSEKHVHSCSRVYASFFFFFSFL